MNNLVLIQSDSIDKLAGSLIAVQSEIRDAEKNDKNPHFDSKFANLEAVIDATRLPFAKHGLVVTQLATVVDGKPALLTQLIHSSGQWIRSMLPIMNEKGTAQGLGSGLTYARRYALAAIAGITQVDDDGNEASERPPAPPRPSGKPSPIKALPSDKPISGPTPKAQDSAMRRSLLPTMKSAKWTQDQVVEFIKQSYGVDKTKDLSDAQFSEMLQVISTMTYAEAEEAMHGGSNG